MYSGSFRSPPKPEEVEDEEDREEVEDDNGLVEPEGGLGAFLFVLDGDPDLGGDTCGAEEGLLPGWLLLFCIGPIGTCLSPSDPLLEPFISGGSTSIRWLFRLLDLEGLVGSWGVCFPSGGDLLSCCKSTTGDGDFLSLTRVMSMCVMGIGSLNLSPENILFLSGSCVGEILIGVLSSLS